MYLNRRKSGFYYIQYFDIDDQRIKRVSTSTRKKKDALVFLNEFNKSLQSNTVKKSTSLIDFGDEYIQYIGHTFSEKYLSSIELSFRQLLNYIGNPYLKKISVRQVQEFCSITHKRTEKGDELYLRTLKAAFNRAVEWKYIEVNPFKKVKLPKSQKTFPVFITEQELEVIIDQTKNEELKLLFTLAFYTGMRLWELTNLKWGHVDLNRCNIAVKNDKSFSSKSKKDRIISLNKKMSDLLISKGVNANLESSVFLKGRGIKFNNDNVTKNFKKAVRKTALNDKIHFHTLRHSFASRLVQRGASIYVVKELLGHSDVTTTQIYRHLE